MMATLKTVIKECRDLLEKDCRAQARNPGQLAGTAKRSVAEQSKDAALSLLLSLATLRCFEVQVWRSPSLLAQSAKRSPESRLQAAHDRLQQDIALPFDSLPDQFVPEASVLRIIFHHFTETITTEHWRTDHILGWMYYSFHNGVPEQKQQGRFYTPDSIARYIVTHVLRHAFANSDNLPKSFAVLDLACGCGAFALQVFDGLYEFIRRNNSQGNGNDEILCRILERHLFLIDNDRRACQIATLSLYLKAKSISASCRIQRMNIFCADALYRWEHARSDALPALTEVSSGILRGEPSESGSGLAALFRRRYDVVVGNPPYRVINQLHISKAQKFLYKSYRSAAFKINLFALCVERGLEVLRPQGVLGMIVPNTALHQVYFEALRSYILDNAKILRVLDTKGLFADAAVENCILLLQQEADITQRAEHVVECVTRDSCERRKILQDRYADPAALESTTHCPQHYFVNAPLKRFHVHWSESLAALMQKIAGNHPRLGEVCESHDGVNPGNARQKLIVTENLDETCRPVLNGRNIGRYRLAWDGLYVRYNRDILSAGDTMRWGHRPSLDAAKILTRQTADRIIGAFDSGAYYVTNSIHTTILREPHADWQLKYILGLLNSTLLSFYYRKLIAETGQVFAQVKLVNLRQLPLAPASHEKQREIVGYVEHLLTHFCTAQGGPDIERKQAYREEVDRELDRCVYALYKLSADEMRIIEEDMGATSKRGYPK